MYRQSEKNLIFKSLHVLFAQLECDAFTSHNSAHPLTPKSTEKNSYFSSQENNSCWSTAASITKSKCFNLKLHCMIFFFLFLPLATWTHHRRQHWTSGCWVTVTSNQSFSLWTLVWESAWSMNLIFLMLKSASQQDQDANKFWKMWPSADFIQLIKGVA